MTTKIYKIIILLILSCLYANGQLTCFSGNTSYTVLQNGDSLLVEAEIQSLNIESTRALKSVFSSTRLKAADLMGSYLLFTENYPELSDNSELFNLFTSNTNYTFRANIKHLKSTSFRIKDGVRSAKFSCLKNDFKIEWARFSNLPKIEALCRKNFLKHKRIQDLELLLHYDDIALEEYIGLINNVFSGEIYAGLPVKKASVYNRGKRFQESLYEVNLVLETLATEIEADIEISEGIYKRILCAEMVSISPELNKKNKYYSEGIRIARDSKLLWDEILTYSYEFAIENKVADPDVFDALLMYPGLVDPFSFAGGINGTDYQNAAKCFNNNKMDSCLYFLRLSMELEGVNLEKLVLATAAYREMKEYKKALCLIIHAANLDISGSYVAGNLFALLSELNFHKINELYNQLAMLKTDLWSKQILDKYKP